MTIGELLDITPCLCELHITIRKNGDGRYIQALNIAPNICVYSDARSPKYYGDELEPGEIYDCGTEQMPVRYICINPHEVDDNIRNLKICRINFTKAEKKYNTYVYKGYPMGGWESSAIMNCFPDGYVAYKQNEPDLKDQMNIYDFIGGTK